MFKYKKKLTSVVVMFAILIVFSSSNVYAKHQKVATDLTKFLENDDERFQPFKLFFLFGNVFDRIAYSENNFRKASIRLKQGSAKEKYFESYYDEATEHFELTEKGKADFEIAKAKEKSREGDGEGEGEGEGEGH